jgi:hypothetical protein
MKRAELNNIVKRLCTLTGYVNNRTDAILQNKASFIFLEEGFDGYYSIWEVTTDNGMRDTPFNTSRHAYKSNEMATFLYGLMWGISYGIELGKPVIGSFDENGDTI